MRTLSGTRYKTISGMEHGGFCFQFLGNTSTAKYNGELGRCFGLGCPLQCGWFHRTNDCPTIYDSHPTGLLFSLKPVFAAVFAFAFAGEILTGRGYFGAALVLFGVVTAELDVKKLLTRKGYKKNNVGSEINLPQE